MNNNEFADLILRLDKLAGNLLLKPEESEDIVDAVEVLRTFQWQPIETAPHDKWLLLAEPPAPPLNHWVLKVGKALWGECPGTRGRAGYATHWMPIPIPPEDKG